MHAVYHFLCKTDLTQSDADIREDVASRVEDYLNNHGDENNWSSNIAVVTKDNRVLPFDDDARYTAPNDTTFEGARLFALRCVATDMDLAGNRYGFGTKESDPTENMDFATLEAHIRKEVPEMLAKMYGEKVGKTGDKFDLSDYTRKKLAQGFEIFTDSENAPFGRPYNSPYDYRCYDLTDGEGDANAIVQVDIHT